MSEESEDRSLQTYSIDELDAMSVRVATDVRRKQTLLAEINGEKNRRSWTTMSPHPPFAKYAMRFYQQPGEHTEDVLLRCWEHAVKNAPSDCSYAIRRVGDTSFEWYSPPWPSSDA